MISITQFFLRVFKPSLFGLITRAIYFGSNVNIGKNFRADSVPRIIIEKNCQLVIGNNVELRRNVEVRLHKKSKIYIEDCVRIDRGVRFLSDNNSIIRIGKGTRIGLYSVLNGGDSIQIGKKSLISGFVYIQTSMHSFSNKSFYIQDQGFAHKPVVLEENTWLGAHVVLLPGVTIGHGGIVGSNAVVTKNVLPFKIVGGVPAKELNER